MQSKDDSTSDCKNILSDDEKNECVEKLRVLILGDEILKKHRTYDAYLLRFLHCTDFNVDVAYKRMQDYCQLLLKHPDWFPLTFCAEVKLKLQRNAKAFLPHCDKIGRRIFVVHLRKMDISQSSPELEARLDEILFETVMDEPATQANGVCLILDLKDVSWKFLQWMAPQTVRVSSQKADLYPLKELIHHVVNTNSLTNTAKSLVWPFMSERIKKTVFFHSDNWQSLHEHIDPEILPAEYGGTGPEIDFDKYCQLLLERDEEINNKIRHELIQS